MVERRSTSPRKCVQQEWSSTGETPDAVGSAFQTANSWWPSDSAGTTSACRNRHRLVSRSRHTITSKWRVCQTLTILPESLLWEERLCKTKISTTEPRRASQATCMEPHRGWTIASSSWNCLWKRWLDREQEWITVLQEETKRTEEKEEAGFRSPTWWILRALQKINKAKRLECEAVMSAPPFFQLAGQGDLKFWERMTDLP